MSAGTGVSYHSVSNWKIPSCHARNVIILFIAFCCTQTSVFMSVCEPEGEGKRDVKSQERAEKTQEQQNPRVGNEWSQKSQLSANIFSQLSVKEHMLTNSVKHTHTHVVSSCVCLQSYLSGVFVVIPLGFTQLEP